MITNNTALGAASNPLVTSRVLSLVSASVFDAVNGIDPEYKSIHVRPDAPRHASPRAAAIEAAYTILINAYPGLTPALTDERDASIAGLCVDDSPRWIEAGITWGQAVAQAMWLWRSSDGFAPPPPPFLGVLGIVGSPAAIGLWRPTPLLNASAAGPQFATMTPWVLRRPSQFRLPPPNSLTSAEYAADYNESKIMGAYSGSGRTSDQSEMVLFWAGNTPLYWNRIAVQLASSHSFKLVENAHLFALLNVSMTDALIAAWDTKYRYVYWRPITRSGPATWTTTLLPWLTLTGFPGSTSCRRGLRPILNIPLATRPSADRQQRSCREFPVRTLPLPSRQRCGRAREASPTSQQPWLKLQTLGSLAEFTSAVPVCGAMRSVERSRITSPGM